MVPPYLLYRIADCRFLPTFHQLLPAARGPAQQETLASRFVPQIIHL